MAVSYIPYCGAPPTPDNLWHRWNLDPVLLTVLVVILGVYLAGLRRSPAAGRRGDLRPWAFVAGWATLALALVSPLCPLSVSLFSARVGQHMVLTLLAAPLLVLGRPVAIVSGFWPGLTAWARRLSLVTQPMVAAPAFALAIWFWHAPGPYAATFSSTLIYWLMHITIVGSALLVWSVLLDPEREGTLGAFAAGAASTLQMTLLGALITMTPNLLYAPHILTPYAWGLMPLIDQQIGGLIMWVPGCSVFLAATLYSLAKLLADRPSPSAMADA